MTKNAETCCRRFIFKDVYENSYKLDSTGHQRCPNDISGRKEIGRLLVKRSLLSAHCCIIPPLLAWHLRNFLSKDRAEMEQAPVLKLIWQSRYAGQKVTSSPSFPAERGWSITTRKEN